MTTNERIARWAGITLREVDADADCTPMDEIVALAHNTGADSGDYVIARDKATPSRDTILVLMGFVGFDHWDPEHNIRCWHGEHGLLAKIEEKGLRGQFLRQLGDGTMPADQVSANKSAEANLQELLWRICRAEAPQLAAAFVQVIEEAPDA